MDSVPVPKGIVSDHSPTAPRKPLKRGSLARGPICNLARSELWSSMGMVQKLLWAGALQLRTLLVDQGGAACLAPPNDGFT